MIESIALTGASGVLGRHIADLFSKKKIKVFATSRKKLPLKNNYIFWKSMNLEKLKNFKKLDGIFGNSKVLIHAGAYVPLNSKFENIKKINKINIKSTYLLHKWAKKNNAHFIFISGAIVYKNKKNCKENSPLINKKNSIFYGYAKKVCENYLKIKINKKEPITILRPSSIYGWGQKKNKITIKILIAAKLQKKITLYKPFGKINFIHARDIANAIYKCISKKQYGHFNLGFSKMYTIEDLAKISIKLNRSKSRIEVHNTNKILKENFKFDINSGLAKKKLGWIPKINLKKGIKLIQDRSCG